MVRGIQLTGCYPGMIRCLKCHLYLTCYRARFESDRVEAAWYSTTVLLSGRDRTQWFRVQNSVDRSIVATLPSSSLLVARASNAKSDRYLQPMMWGEETLQCLTTSALNNKTYHVHYLFFLLGLPAKSINE